MNEFTKEELGGLKNLLLHSREDYPTMHEDKDWTALLNKIQYLIDSDCEHDGWASCRFCGEDFRGLKDKETQPES